MLGMASSSLSQEDVDQDLGVVSTRRYKVRAARANAVSRNAIAMREPADGGDGAGEFGPSGVQASHDHDASPKPCSRAKDKRCSRPNHPPNKCKAQRERRKLREKRRSTGVVHLQSTESTGGSTGEEDEELLSMSAETRRNTVLNEASQASEGSPVSQVRGRAHPRKNKSASDLDADDEDNNQDPEKPVGSHPEEDIVEIGLQRALLLDDVHKDPASQDADRLRLVAMIRERDMLIRHLRLEVKSMAKELKGVLNENQELRQMNSALLDGTALTVRPPREA